MSNPSSRKLDAASDSPLAELLRPLVDSFRLELEAGDSPSIEDRLTRTPAAARPELCRLLILEEWRAKAEAGEALDVAAYRERFGMLVDASWLRLVARAIQTSADGDDDSSKFAALAWGVEGDDTGRDRSGLDATGKFEPRVDLDERPRVDLDETAAADDPRRRTTPDDRSGDDDLTQDFSVSPPPGGSAASATGAGNSTANPGGTLPLPYRLGRYRLVSVLGKGGFGDVYLAEDPHLDRTVAVKTPRLTAEERREGSLDARLETLLEEARNAAKLERVEGVVPIYDAGREGDLGYIVTQFIDGGSLADLLKGGRLPLAQALRLFASVCDVVDRAHRAGWTHRDLKPSNILLGADGRTFLTDFGLSARFGQRDSVDTQGTPRYMAPEIAQATLDRLAGVATSERRETIDGRADLYSLGVTFYQMLTGRYPVDGERLRDALEQIVGTTPPTPHEVEPDVPEALSALCMRMLEKDPARRPESAGDVAASVRRTAAWLRLDEPPERRSRRKRWIAAVIGAIGGLVLLVVALYWLVGAD